MTDYRGAVLQAAISQLGQGNLAEYWSSALGKPQAAPIKKAWCGIFVLRNLHEAGLAAHVFWEMGVGFLTTPARKWLLPTTDKPQIGDIGVQEIPYNHHFLVESVDPDGLRVHSVDGNSGAHSTVNRATHPVGHGCVYFSIAPLIALVGVQDALPTPSKPPPMIQPALLQKALNSLAIAHPDNAPSLLTIDGIIGPRSIAAIRWAQAWFHLNPTGDQHDPQLLQKLGLQ